MSRPIAAALVLALVLGSLATAAPAAAGRLRVHAGPAPDVLHGGLAGLAKSEVDTVYILGGPDRQDGRFETAQGAPDWHGWTHRDMTLVEETFWSASDVAPLAGQYSFWCGAFFGLQGDDPGYGNNWDQQLRFAHAVAAPSAEVAVRWTGLIRTDTEPGYDYVYLQANRGGTWENLLVLDGAQEQAIDLTVVLAAAELVGEGGDEVQLRVRVVSDGLWSDEDGLFDSDGACWLDDLTVTVDGVLVSEEDFEDQDPGDWQAWLPTGVGDFAALYSGLQEVDFCLSNYSVQVAFVDDGVVVPGTGGSECLTWCYGPGGYIVNNTGGLLGPDFHLHNRIESPVLAWPAGADGARLAFDVYRHEEFTSPDVWPGIFYNWGIRSTADPVNDPIAAKPYENRGFLYPGGPQYWRHDELVADLLETGRVQVQIMLEVQELGHYWNYNGIDGTPAPYFDNVSLRAFPYGGPAMAGRSIDLANDGFPEQGFHDPDDLASNSVRFDMAQNVSPEDHLRNDPGDSLVIEVTVVRAGAELIRPPRMYVRMRANPVFDAVRSLPAGFTASGGVVSGFVAGDTVRVNGNPISDRFAFDLPDTGFFYPGDVLRYYFEAGDATASDARWATLPADTTGFASFASGVRYDQTFEVRALPTVHHAAGGQPSLLVWDDAGGGVRHDALWYYALGNNGFIRGEDYDLYVTRGPGSGIGNGLGARATPALMAGYDALVYTAGSLSLRLLGNGDFETDPSDDLGLLTGWLDSGGKSAFFMGDNLYSSTAMMGAAGETFVAEYLGAQVVSPSIRPFIGMQTSPLVRAIPGPWAPYYADEWIVAGGCPVLNDFDAVEATAGSVRLTEFTDPNGNDGVFPWAAMLRRYDGATARNVFSMPFDLLSAQNAPGWEPPSWAPLLPVRAVLLDEILTNMGEQGSGPPIAVDETPAPLRIAQYPNPFNPRTTIALDLPRAAHVALHVFDLRGALVRTLVDERLAAGRHEVLWDGADGAGRPAASGVYFAEVRTLGERRLQKMTLVR